MARGVWALAIWSAGLLGASAGPSISSCGGQSDILQNVVIHLSPDPVRKGGTLRLEVSGSLSKALTAGSARADLDVKALVLGHELFDDKVNMTTPFTLQPGVPGGDTRITVGPVQLPDVPGSVDVTGKLLLADEKGAQVACIALDTHISASADETAAAAAPHGLATPVISSCARPNDHLQNVHVSSSGGVTTLSGTFDEDLTTMSFAADLKLHAGFIPVPVKLSVPVAFAPGLKKGDVKATVGPVSEGPAANPAVRVTGSVTWLDAAEEEVSCISISDPGASLLVV